MIDGSSFHPPIDPPPLFQYTRRPPSSGRGVGLKMGWYYHPPECMCVCCTYTEEKKWDSRIGWHWGRNGDKKGGLGGLNPKRDPPQSIHFMSPHTHTATHAASDTHYTREKTGWLEWFHFKKFQKINLNWICCFVWNNDVSVAVRSQCHEVDGIELLALGADFETKHPNRDT